MQQLALTCLWHVYTVQELLSIWSYITTLKKEKARTALYITCLARVRALQLNPPKITHTVAFLLLGLSFHTNDPDIVSNTIKIFMFPYLSLTEGTEAALVL